MTLAEALGLVDLEPGRTYRCRVKGFEVELRVLDEKKASAQASKADFIFSYMKLFTIEECDLAPGDLCEAEADMKLLSRSDETALPDTLEIVTKAKEEQSILPHPSRIHSSWLSTVL